MDRYSPVGVIDSGVGGLTVAKQLKRSLPNEDILYFGDSKNMPYGNRSIVSKLKEIYMAEI